MDLIFWGIPLGVSLWGAFCGYVLKTLKASQGVSLWGAFCVALGEPLRE